MRADGTVNIKIIVGILVFAASCVSAGLYADDRYAKQTDLKTFIASSTKKTEQAANVLRKQLLEDKIFELDLVPEKKKTDVQRAMANRSKTQLQEVQTKINSVEQN